MRNADFRIIAQRVLRDWGFDVRVKSGRGYLPGARLVVVRAGKEKKVAVKASQERVVSFTRQPDQSWRTLRVVDLVVAVVPGDENPEEADVYAFEKKALIRVFDRAWRELEKAGRPIGFNIPVFIPLDEVSRKNVGHNVGNLKRHASPPVHLSAEQLAELLARDEDNYIDAFRRRFAAENGVEIGQVAISIVGETK